MSRLTKSDVLEFPENVEQIIRKQYGLDNPERMEEALDIIVDWIKKQNHFTKKDFDRRYLETCLINCKGSVERTKERIEKLCTLKTLLPEYFTDVRVDELYVGLEKAAGGIVPKMDEDNCRVYVLKNSGVAFSTENFKRYFTAIAKMAEYLRLHDYSNGYVFIADFTEVNVMDFVTGVNLIDLRNFITLIMEGYGLRLKGLHLLVSPTTMGKVVDMCVSIFKMILSEKLASRFHVHQSLDSLLKHVPQEILTVEYGGKENITLRELIDKWNKVLSSDEHVKFLNEMNQAKILDSYRQSNKFHNDHLGISGSFRKLDVD